MVKLPLAAQPRLFFLYLSALVTQIFDQEVLVFPPLYTRGEEKQEMGLNPGPLALLAIAIALTTGPWLHRRKCPIDAYITNH